MIVFDLRCQHGHVFEAWFGSTDDFESQQKRGLVSCPICGDAGVEKALMAPRIGAKGNQAPAGSDPGPAETKALLRKLAELQAKMLSGSEDVGSGFSSEARSMHLGESEKRSIHGQATLQEAKSLIEDGIPVAPLPLPVRSGWTEN